MPSSTPGPGTCALGKKWSQMVMMMSCQAAFLSVGYLSNVKVLLNCAADTCTYSVLSREKYDSGTLTAIKHYIGTGNSKLMRQPACPITFQSDETSSDLQRTRRVQTIKPPDRLDLKGNWRSLEGAVWCRWDIFTLFLSFMIWFYPMLIRVLPKPILLCGLLKNKHFLCEFSARVVTYLYLVGLPSTSSYTCR